MKNDIYKGDSEGIAFAVHGNSEDALGIWNSAGPVVSKTNQC